jgi:hypothetical protein
MADMTRPDERAIPVRITLPDGAGYRVGWYEPWRNLLVWKEPAEHDDRDELGEREGWYWAHLHDSLAEFEESS